MRQIPTVAGLVFDTEIATVFDQANDRIVGRIRNEASVPVCDVSVLIVLDDTMSGLAVQADGFIVGGRAEFELALFGQNTRVGAPSEGVVMESATVRRSGF